jgi:FKBP-type peptidyl-prolyl cis-trans isomerase 2
LRIGIAATLFFLVGCIATGQKTVQPGDRVLCQYTCRYGNGDIVATTSEKVAQDPAMPKSVVFLPQKQCTAVEVIAEEAGTDQNPAWAKGFDGVIKKNLARAVTGAREKEQRSVELRGKWAKGQNIIQMAKVRRRPKEMRMTKEEYTLRTSKSPEMGQPFTIDPAVPGKVTEVTEKEVVIRFCAIPGSKTDTPFGKGTVREEEKYFLIEIHAEKGTLVRTGPMVGRIVDVNDRFLTIDYGHPFGGEPLICDFTVESVEKQEERK